MSNFRGYKMEIKWSTLNLLNIIIFSGETHFNSMAKLLIKRIIAFGVNSHKHHCVEFLSEHHKLSSMK